MLDAIAEHFPGEATWTHPAGGFYVWVTLPGWIDTRAMLAAAVERRVAYVSGNRLLPDGRGGNQMRLAFCYPPEDRIREGIARLGSLLDDERAALREPASVRVAVIAGGRTPERDVSLRSGHRVRHALEEGGHEPGWSTQARWRWSRRSRTSRRISAT